MRPQVVNLSTGAWFDPIDPTVPDSLCAHGNPNVLTADRGSSRLAQGSSGQHVLVEIERYDGRAAAGAGAPPAEVRRAPATRAVTAGTVAKRIARLPWDALADDIDEHGFAVTPAPLLNAR